MISYSRKPPGAWTWAISPAYLPIRARATGEFTEILPTLMSASSSPTIWGAEAAVEGIRHPGELVVYPIQSLHAQLH